MWIKIEVDDTSVLYHREMMMMFRSKDIADIKDGTEDGTEEGFLERMENKKDLECLGAYGKQFILKDAWCLNIESLTGELIPLKDDSFTSIKSCGDWRKCLV